MRPSLSARRRLAGPLVLRGEGRGSIIGWGAQKSESRHEREESKL